MRCWFCGVDPELECQRGALHETMKYDLDRMRREREGRSEIQEIIDAARSGRRLGKVWVYDSDEGYEMYSIVATRLPDSDVTAPASVPPDRATSPTPPDEE